jgi:ABC-2 type transport system ATP-binding protein
MNESPAIYAEKLHVKKDGATVLKDISFSVRRGTITGLIGPSGSGKTTLMRAIVGVQKHEGALLVLGESAGSSVLRKNIGYMSQALSVYSDLTVMQNLQYFATLERANKSQIKAVLSEVRLTEFRNQLVKNLSGGQQARVSLAVALLGNPDLLVLDEPTVGLDPLLRRDLWQLFRELAASGKTLLVSSHVMDEAERCHDLLLMRDGQLLWHDSRTKLLHKTGAISVEDAFIKMVQTKGTL